MYSRTRRQQYTILDQRILALHRAMADKVIAEPNLLVDVKNTLEQRYQGGVMRYGSYIMWQSILDTYPTPDKFKALLIADDEATAKLRRKTIFVGVLSEIEREEALLGM